MSDFESRKSLFVSGMVIELDRLPQLQNIERMVLPIAHPEITPGQRNYWKADYETSDNSLAISKVRPKGYIGSIIHSRLQVMPEPRQRLLAAIEEGTVSVHNASLEWIANIADEADQYYMGFDFIAQADSSKPQNRGDIQAQLWYCPAWTRENGKRIVNPNWRSGVRRIIPLPTYIKLGERTPDYQPPAFNNVTQRIGFMALHEAAVGL